MNCSPPGSSVHWLLQARTLEWIAIPFSRGFSPPRDQTQSPALQADSFHLSHQGGPHQTKPSFNYYPPQLYGTVIHLILSSFLCICLPLIYPSTSSFPLKFHYCVLGNSFCLVKSLQPYLSVLSLLACFIFALTGDIDSPYIPYRPGVGALSLLTIAIFRQYPCSSEFSQRVGWSFSYLKSSRALRESCI